MTWLPTYFASHYHLKLIQVGFYTMLPWLVAAVMMWLTGMLTDFIFKRTYSLRLSRTYPIFFSQLLSAICILPLITVLDVRWAITFLSLAVGFIMSANACYFSVNIDIAKERSGTALGIMDMLLAISGFVAPALTGFIVQTTGTFESAFLLLTFLALSSAALIFLFHNKERANNSRNHARS